MTVDDHAHHALGARGAEDRTTPTPPDADPRPRRWRRPAIGLAVLAVGGLIAAGVPLYLIGYVGLAAACVGMHLLMGHSGHGGHGGAPDETGPRR
jgi:Protein of unknown function (DUF2933)